MKYHKKLFQGVIIVLSISFSYVGMGIITKVSLSGTSNITLLFWQSLIGLIIISSILWVKQYKIKTLFSQFSRWQLIRSVSSLASIFFLFLCLSHISIFLAYIILNMAPFVVLPLRKILFQANITKQKFYLTLFAFIGLMIILNPKSTHLDYLGLLWAILSCICLVISVLMLEKDKHTDRLLTIFYYFFIASLIIIPILLSNPIQLQSFYNTHLFNVILIGLLFFWIQTGVIIAVKYINSHLMTILFYSEVIFALSYSLIFETLHSPSLFILGASIVIFSGIVLVLDEASINIQASENNS